MSKFTKTMIASALAVAVAGPAAADFSGVKENGAFSGSKTTVKITPSGCPNFSAKNIDTEIGFEMIDIFLEATEGFPGVEAFTPFAGCWDMTLFSFAEFGHGDGLYIERKVGKDLTMSLSGDTFVDGFVDAMDNYLVSESKCDYNNNDLVLLDNATVKKAQTKLSKNGDRAKVDIQVDTKYNTTDAKTKNVKMKISGKMDFDALEINPAIDCGFDIIRIEPF